MALTPEQAAARDARRREYAREYRLTHPGQAKITRKARREWQRDNGLTGTGQVKANTLRKEHHD